MNSKLITITSPSDQATYMDNMYKTGNGSGNGNGKEFNVPIILDADEGTLGFGTPQQSGTVDSAPLSYSTYRGNSYTQNGVPDQPENSGQLIIGVAHPHPETGPGMTLIPGVSTITGPNGGNDVTTAHDIKGVSYAIDKNNVHKVDQHGNVTNNLPRSTEILRDALETRAGLHH